MSDFSTSINGNDDDLFALFLLMVAFWATSWIICYVYKGGIEAFVSYSPLFVFHSVMSVFLSSLSLYFGDDEIFPERVANSFSMSFFIVDLFDCIVRKDVPFIIHAALGLSTLTGCYMTPIHQELRSASKGMMIEISTPFLYLWKKTKKKSHFILLAMTFTGCRIIWLSIYLYQMYRNESIPSDFIYISSFLLLPLQVVWWFKLMALLLNYHEGHKLVKEE